MHKHHFQIRFDEKLHADTVAELNDPKHTRNLGQFIDFLFRYYKENEAIKQNNPQYQYPIERENIMQPQNPKAILTSAVAPVTSDAEIFNHVYEPYSTEFNETTAVKEVTTEAVNSDTGLVEMENSNTTFLDGLAAFDDF